MRLKKAHMAVVLVVAIASLAVTAGVAAPDASSGTQQACWPSAQVPYVWQYDRTGAAHTYIEWCNYSYVAHVYLKNRAGNTLRHDAWYIPAGYGGVHLVGARVSCAGAYVSTHMYMDIGISDISGENGSCAY